MIDELQIDRWIDPLLVVYSLGYISIGYPRWEEIPRQTRMYVSKNFFLSILFLNIYLRFPRLTLQLPISGMRLNIVYVDNNNENGRKCKINLNFTSLVILVLNTRRIVYLKGKKNCRLSRMSFRDAPVTQLRRICRWNHRRRETKSCENWSN